MTRSTKRKCEIDAAIRFLGALAPDLCARVTGLLATDAIVKSRVDSRRPLTGDRNAIPQRAAPRARMCARELCDENSNDEKRGTASKPAACRSRLTL